MDDANLNLDRELVAEFKFSEPWERVEPRSEIAGFLAHQLSLELAPSHPLYGQPASIIGRSVQADDVLVAVPKAWGIVHLTWSGRPEVAGHPHTDLFDDPAKAQRVIDIQVAEYTSDWETYDRLVAGDG